MLTSAAALARVPPAQPDFGDGLQPGPTEPTQTLRDPLALAVNLGRCTCGSGANPRRCTEHPERFQEHIDEMNRENEADLAAHPEGDK